MSATPPILVYLCAIGYALITGFSFYFGKLALVFATPLVILAHRFTIAFLGLLLLWGLGILRPGLSFRALLPILPLALFYPLAFFGLQTFGLNLATSAEAGLLMAMIPVFTLLLSALCLKEKTSLGQKLAMTLSVSGVLLILAANGHRFQMVHTWGLLLLLLSSVSFASYTVLARRLCMRFSPLQLTFVMIPVSLIGYSLPMWLRAVSLKHGLLFWSPFTEPIYALSIVYLGFFSTLLTALMTSFVLSRISAVKMSVFGNVSTLISMFAGVLLLEEVLGPSHWLGALLIILGVAGVNLFGSEKHPPGI